MMAEATQLPPDQEFALTERQLDPHKTGRTAPAPFLNHNMPPQLDTTYRTEFDPKDMSELTIGARVMKVSYAGGECGVWGGVLD